MAYEAPTTGQQASPTLTNPDMILPPQNLHTRQTPSPPPNASNLGRMSSYNAGNKRRSALGPRLPIAGTARPSMPGSWQSESDFHDASGSLTRKASLSHSQQPKGAGQRISRTGSLRASTTWQRTSSREGVDGSGPNLLGSGTRRPTLAERLDEEDPPGSPYTTTSESNAEDDDNDDIGSRAEEILANAKKRLTAMEGNLTRARSMSTTRTASPASSSGELHQQHQHQQPRFSKRVSRSTMGAGNSWAMASTKLRQASLQGGSGHLRVFSETAASTKRSSTSSPQRSMSALGHGHASPSASPALRTEWTDTSSSDSFSNSLPRHLEPLHEDEIYADDLASQHSPLVHQASNASLMYQTPSSSTSTLSRARSSIALRDLQEGVGDLQDKVKQLKERTKRESMRRASLQRLKTPSPFTNAESWLDTRDRESKVSIMSTETAVKVTESTPPNPQGEFQTKTVVDLQEPLSAASSGSMYSIASNNFKSPVNNFHVQHGPDLSGDSPLLPIHPRIRHIPPTPTTPLKRHTPNESTDSSQSEPNDFSDPISPSISDSFPPPPDTAPTPPRSRSNSAARSTRSRSSSSVSQSNAVSHEDNPDAFDYSRFLLDSAMGTYALDKGRSRSPSGSSTGTQSTTRPRKSSTARLSKASNTSAASRASTAKRVSLSPSQKSRTSSGSSGSNQTLAQRRASGGRSNSTASLQSIVIPDGRRSVSPRRASGLSDATSPPATLSPPTQGKPAGRPGLARQPSMESVSAASVASFATALERASSQLTMRSMSRNALRSAGSSAVPAHRTALEAYSSSRNNSFVSAVSSHSPPATDDMPPTTLATNNKATNSSSSTSLSSTSTTTPQSSAAAAAAALLAASKRDTQSALNALLIDEADALRTPTSPPVLSINGTVNGDSLPRNISKASAAILSAVLAVSHAAVREDDEHRRGAGDLPASNLDAPRLMAADDEALLGHVVDGVLAAALGLIGRSSSSSAAGKADDKNSDAGTSSHGRMGNSWRKSAAPGSKAAGGEDDEDDEEPLDPEESREIDAAAIEQQREIWRMRCEVARRALSEAKPGEGF